MRFVRTLVTVCPPGITIMSKFCANLSFMFTEVPFLERYELAKKAGFHCVESGFPPYDIPLQKVVKAKEDANIQQCLVNIYTGDVSKLELGFAAIPGKEEEFQKSLDLSINYAKALKVKKMHVMSGIVKNPTTENDVVYEKNLRLAVKMFEKENIIGLIEPINNYSVEDYYMNNFDKAIALLKKINSPNLRLMLDVFHLQQLKGDFTHFVSKYMEYVGHVQIAQVPYRHEPDSTGELNYRYVIDTIRSCGYTDYIGLEYKPETDTLTGLKWLENLGFTL